MDKIEVLSSNVKKYRTSLGLFFTQQNGLEGGIIMGAFTGAQTFFNCPLVEVARRLGYSQDNVLILQGDLQALQNSFPETYRNIMSCRHHRDNRTPLEYAQDLVASWLVEDSFLEILNSNGLRATLFLIKHDKPYEQMLKPLHQVTLLFHIMAIHESWN